MNFYNFVTGEGLLKQDIKELTIKEKNSTFNYIKIRTFIKAHHKENEQRSHELGKDICHP